MAPHHALVDRAIVDLVCGRAPYQVLIINEPPRHGKSEHVSHWTPAWAACRFPDDYTGVASYSTDQAKTFGLMALESFRQAAPHFGLRVDRARAAATHWGVWARRGGMRSAGQDGGWTGKGFRLLILDDLIKSSEEAMSERQMEKQWDWFLSTARTRLEPGAGIIVMQTRWVPNDLTGNILAGKLAGFTHRHINLPAIAEAGDELGRAIGEPLWPGRWPLEALNRFKGPGEGDYWWSAMYQGRPKQHARASFPDEYFDEIYARTWPDWFEISVLFTDPVTDAKKGDDAAIVFVGLRDGKLYVDADVRRIPASELPEAVVSMAADYQPDELCFEANGFQSLLAGEFDRYIDQQGYLAWPIVPMENHSIKKEIRIHRIGGPLRLKQLRFRKGSPGVERLISQLRAHPMADFDDGPDALECAIRRIRIIAGGIIQQAEDDAA